MGKLPINLLLYVLILGLLGMSGWEFYLAITADKNRKDRQSVTKKEYTAIMERGRNRQQIVSGPDYAQKAYWDNFWQANFIGKLPPKPVEKKDEKQEEVKTSVAQTPLEDILDIVAIIFVDDSMSSRVIVRYKPEANVQMPAAMRAANEAAQKAQAADAKALANRPAPSADRRGNRRNNQKRNTPKMPAFGANNELIHQIALEGTLWPEFEHIRLVRIAEDASRAWFVREDASKPKEEWKEEFLWRVEFNLDQSMLDKVRKFRGDGETGDQRPAEEKPANVASVWQPTKQTERIKGRRNAWNVGNDDLDFMRNEDGAQRLFNEELHLGNYKNRTGVRVGVRVNKVSPRMQRFGIVAGDVIISLNGQPVKSKAAAIKVGKRLHKRGVRTFEVEFLSRGKRVIRTYVAPDK